MKKLTGDSTINRIHGVVAAVHNLLVAAVQLFKKTKGYQFPICSRPQNGMVMAGKINKRLIAFHLQTARFEAIGVAAKK